MLHRRSRRAVTVYLYLPTDTWWHLVHLSCRRSRRDTFSNGSETCWARFKTCCSAQQSSPLCRAAHLTPIRSWVSLFWCFTFAWSSETLNCLERETFKHRYLLYLFLFFCVQGTGLCGANAFHVGGWSETDGRGDDPPRQARSAAQLPLKIPACGCVWV